ncbi:inositol-3-phosphate synthase [Ammonicoccus fulvus]|uniref:Inositol-3-phosphate synthase n=1 Tax=Ammonicoccus fulvus TaxID=3138240 RepID=A0ABZ3FQ05_9ACTN
MALAADFANNSSDPGDRAPGQVGLWLVGARGSIGVTTAVGLAAIAAGAADLTGCVTACEELAGLPLLAAGDIVLGGHDISATPVTARAEQLAVSGMLPTGLVELSADALEAFEAWIRPGVTAFDAGAQAAVVARLVEDIEEFRAAHDLARVIVVDVSSTEALPEDRPELDDPELLEAALGDSTRKPLPPSALYALAAIRTGSPLACFTPSASLGIPALQTLAADVIPYAGQDGKTGQTLLRTALAPTLVRRGFRVLSWAGANVLGGGDGATLADPVMVQSKLHSKNRGLRALIGEQAATPLHIDNVPDLGDIKTAWDHVHAEGFLGSRITLQTIWTAYDSMLAAPLVIDLVRLLDLADRTGVRGPIGELGFFFKDPWGSDLHDYALQAQALYSWAHERAAADRPSLAELAT